MKKKNNESPNQEQIDYKSLLHPSAHSYLPRQDGMIKNVQESEKGTFDTSELEGEVDEIPEA